jgi:hypothetical protein
LILDKKYPVRLANYFMDSILNSFIDEVKCTFGTQFTSKMETIDVNHYFIKFDRA